MFDRKIKKEFRDTVNEQDWAYKYYSNNNERNQWNCICSAMDWIDVAVDYMCQHPLSAIHGNDSIEMYSYLSCVDILLEAIEQLHRVIFSTKFAIFSKDTDCFPNNQFGQTDRQYFKTLRACFGAHPVRLADPEDPNNDKAKRFASWSGGFGISDDFSVFLYSNKTDGHNILLSIDFHEIERFSAKYYNHLSTLRKELIKQYREYRAKKQSQLIARTDDVLAQLEILQNENVNRLDNSYYASTLKNLTLIFKTEITCMENVSLVQQFRCALEETIHSAFDNLQSMTYGDIEPDYTSITDVKGLPNGWGYGLEKLSSAVHGSGYPEFVWIGLIRSAFEGRFVFQYDSIEELYVLVLAAIYKASLEPNEN